MILVFYFLDYGKNHFYLLACLAYIFLHLQLLTRTQFHCAPAVFL